MWRVVLLLGAVLVVADATGLLAEADDVCCADEENGKQCPPTCPTCRCSWHSIKTAPASKISIRSVQVVSRTVESPAPADAHGQLAPQPTTRPPIASS